jgi:hypothetical protein
LLFTPTQIVHYAIPPTKWSWARLGWVPECNPVLKFPTVGWLIWLTTLTPMVDAHHKWNWWYESVLFRFSLISLFWYQIFHYGVPARNHVKLGPISSRVKFPIVNSLNYSDLQCS